jgi:hypothetical protein
MLTKKPIELTGLVVILLAIGSGFLAAQFHITVLLPIALLMLGLYTAFLGINTILKGRLLMFDHFAMRREYYTGAPAYLLGSAVMFIGAGLIFYSVWVWVRPAQATGFLEILIQSPQGWGLLLLALGFFTFVFGVVRLVAVSASQPEQGKLLKASGLRAEGVIGMLLGILLIGGGFWLAFQ